MSLQSWSMPGNLIHDTFVYFNPTILTQCHLMLHLPLQYRGDLSHSQRSVFEESKAASATRIESTHGQFVKGEVNNKITITTPQNNQIQAPQSKEERGT